jgi:voltage-gated potassium channel Kch
MRLRNVQKLFIVLIVVFFVISASLTSLEGFDIKTSAFWSFMNIMGAAFPPSMRLVDAANIGILLSLIFGIMGEFLVTVLLTTLFYQYMSSINFRAKVIDYKRGKLSRHVVLTPINAFSIDLAKTLKRNKIPFVMLDMHKGLVDRLNGEGMLALYGDATQVSALAYAKILDASYMMLLGDDDIRNMLIAITAKKLNKRIKIAARTKTEEDIPRMHMVGINKVILPEIAIGDEIAGFLLKQKKLRTPIAQ